jgi:NAD+ kinase
VRNLTSSKEIHVIHSSKEVGRIGIVYHPHISGATELSTRLSSTLQADWTCSSEEIGPDLSPVSLVVSIGGDGTILRLARAFSSARIPLVGVNVGGLGFLTEVSVDEAPKLPELIKSGGWIDERSMLQVNLKGETFHILNDAVVARGEIPRTTELRVNIDNEHFTTYRADGVIVASATGSTGYCLASGGPAIHPSSKEMVLLPISPHLTFPYSLVLQGESSIEVEAIKKVVVSLDGQLNFNLEVGEKVNITRSPYTTLFLRFHPPSFFGKRLAEIESRASKNRRCPPDSKSD